MSLARGSTRRRSRLGRAVDERPHRDAPAAHGDLCPGSARGYGTAGPRSVGPIDSAAEQPPREAHERAPVVDGHPCRREGDAHEIGAAEGAACARRPLAAGPRAGARARSRQRGAGRRRRTGDGAWRPKRRRWAPAARIFVQEQQAGTADALLAARAALAQGAAGDVLVLYGDTPLIEAGTIARLRAASTPARRWRCSASRRGSRRATGAC